MPSARLLLMLPMLKKRNPGLSWFGRKPVFPVYPDLVIPELTNLLECLIYWTTTYDDSISGIDIVYTDFRLGIDIVYTDFRLGLKVLAESQYHGPIHAQKMKQIIIFCWGGGGGGYGEIQFLKR